VNPIKGLQTFAQRTGIRLVPNRHSRGARGRLFRGGRVLLGLGLFLGAISGSEPAEAATGDKGLDLRTDWPAWRGPSRDGQATAGQRLPLYWSDTSNVVWRAAIPGRGHGSPTVAGDFIYLPTADPVSGSQSVIGLQRATGRIAWTTVVHKDGAGPGRHANSSAASSTVACNGQQLFISFLNQGAVHTTSLNLQGKILWQTKVCDYLVHQGYAASPVLHESLVLVAADHRGGGVVAAFNQRTGEKVWSHSRPGLPNYTTPAVLQVAGRTQMLLAGCNQILSLDPSTGSKLWEQDGSTEECVVTMVTDGTRVFAGGGYPRNHTVAIVADGSGKVAWQNSTRVYVPSMLVKAGHLYVVTDGGMAVCWNGETGQERWKERLGGEVFASPVMADDRIYASNVAGQMFVFEATPASFRLLARNQLGDESYASPAICDNRLYLRVAQRGPERKEFLYCIGDTTAGSAIDVGGR
jgi:outer membrane protein assembly factor BamB